MIDPRFIDPDLDDRSTLVWRGAALLVVLLLVGCFVLAIGRGVFADDVRVSADVDDIGGSLTEGADVKLRGVIVGKVSGIEARGDGVRLTLTVGVDAAKGVPHGVRARILPASVFGTSYVDLVARGRATGDALAAGQVIEQDRSSETVELQDTLDSTYRVMKAVRPAELATTLSALAGAMRGRGAEVGDTVETLNTYLGRLDPQIPLVREDLRLLADNLTTLEQVSPDLFDAVESSLVTSRTIVTERAQLTSLLAGGTALVDESDRLLTDTERPLVDAIRQSAVVVDALYDERAGISGGFESFTGFARKASGTFDAGPWMKTNVYIGLGAGTPYTAADCPRFGSAVGDCGGSAPSGIAAPRVPSSVDDALIREMKDRLTALDRDGATTRGGVGELLRRPYVGEAR